MTKSARIWSLHCCLLDSECRKHGGLIPRVHLNTPWVHIGLALTPGARAARIGKRSQWIWVVRPPKEA